MINLQNNSRKAIVHSFKEWEKNNICLESTLNSKIRIKDKKFQ